MNVCSHFEEIPAAGSPDTYPNCRIGEPIHQRCGPKCLAYLPQFGKVETAAWTRILQECLECQ